MRQKLGTAAQTPLWAQLAWFKLSQ